MLMLAVQKGASIEQMQQLMDLQERHERNEARKAFVVALNAFKADPPEVLKNRKVGFGNTNYKHAALDDASEIIGAALAEHDISHRWNVEQADGKIKVTCILTHALGHSESVTMEAACCKYFASEMCSRVADRAVQIHGGAGYMAEYAIERFYRDVRLFRLYEGTSQIQQLVIARTLIRNASR